MMDDEILQDYTSEARELLDEMDASLIRLEREGKSQDLLNNLFRAVHCIKGSAEYIGLDRSGTLTHAVESLLSRLREGLMELNPRITDVLFRAKDVIAALIDEVCTGREEKTDISAMMEELAALAQATAPNSRKDRSAEPLLEAPIGSIPVEKSVPETERPGRDFDLIRGPYEADLPEGPDMYAPGPAQPAEQVGRPADFVITGYEEEVVPQEGGRTIPKDAEGGQASAVAGEPPAIDELEAGTTLEETVPFVLNIALYLDDLEDGLSFRDLRSSLLGTVLAIKQSLRYMMLHGAVEILEQMEAQIEAFHPTEETIPPEAVTNLRGLLRELHGYYAPDTFPEEEPTLPEPEATPTEEVSPVITSLAKELQGVPGLTRAVVRSLVDAGFRSTGQLAQADLNFLVTDLRMDPSTAEAILKSARRPPTVFKKRLPAAEAGKRSMLADVDDELLSAFERIFGETEAVPTADRIPEAAFHTRSALELLDHVDAAAGETDQEILKIFLSFGLEQAEKMLPIAANVREGTANAGDLQSLAKAIESLRQSSTYMGYEKLATFLDQWYEKTLDAVDRFASLSREDLRFVEERLPEFQEYLRRLDVALQGAGDRGVVPVGPELPAMMVEKPPEAQRVDEQPARKPELGLPPRGASVPADLEKAVVHTPTPHRPREQPVVAPSPPPAIPEPAAEMPLRERVEEDVRISRDLGRDTPVVRTMRVDAGKVDTLLNQVGELAVNRSFVEQLSMELRNLQRRIISSREMGKREIQGLRNLAMRVGEASVSLGRAANDLQEGVMKLRMLPVGQLFNRMPRLIRDLSQRMNKSVSLVVQGGDTEVDKRIIEQIYNPLVHLIRNAVDHGIEDQDTRRRLGKNPEGAIVLNAYSQGNQVVIDVEDDGAGIDTDAVLDKAVSARLVDPKEARNLSAEQLYDFLFVPGFSTSKKVTRTSGRGVGMDVVKRDVEKINGHVEIESWKGKGTRISIRIPLTLAIIQTLLVGHGRHVFAIPLTTVREIIRVEPQEISTIEGRQVIKFRDETIPILGMDQVFRLKGGEITREARFLVLAIAGYRTVGLLVEDLIGEQDVVIKPLAEHVWKSRGLAGSTILGDGTIALVIDVAELVESVIAQQKQAAARRTRLPQTGRSPGTEMLSQRDQVEAPWLKS